MKIFPNDCDTKCEHFYYYDLSIDDYVYVCNKMNISVDIGWSLFKCACPLEREVEKVG